MEEAILIVDIIVYVESQKKGIDFEI